MEKKKVVMDERILIPRVTYMSVKCQRLTTIRAKKMPNDILRIMDVMI
jgi:hypothetical protein